VRQYEVFSELTNAEGQEKRREREALRHMWEFASVVQFFTIFGSYLRILPSFKIGCEVSLTV
jgi:hypothetical protein